jgi:filamentous hemagglutinin
LGFRTRGRLIQHFDDHGSDFGAADEAYYESLADAFLGGPKGDTVLECTRRYLDHARLRYNYVTQEFGVLAADNYILTYYKPDPAEHGAPTNRTYFERQCGFVA